jgi:AcrR family transcriptional regulator
MRIVKDTNTEQAIIDVAERLFLEKGFSMTSTTEIAKEVGCNQALVNYYFRTKDNLFEAIFEKKVNLFIAIFFKEKNDNIPFKSKVKLIIETHFEVLKANPKIPFLFFNEITTNPKRIEKLKQKGLKLPSSMFLEMEKELKNEIAKGNIRNISSTDLMISIFSLNAMLFIGSPIIKVIGKFTDEEYNKLIEHRKKENVHIILKSLEP